MDCVHNGLNIKFCKGQKDTKMALNINILNVFYKLTHACLPAGRKLVNYLFHKKHQVMAPTEKQKVGALGEDIACKYLINKGFSVIERNYWKKFGEIDIIAKKDRVIHFVEVKSVSRETNSTVSYENYEPTDNIHWKKLERLNRAIQIYLEERSVSDETNWQIDAVSVFINNKTRRARVDMIEDI